MVDAPVVERGVLTAPAQTWDTAATKSYATSGVLRVFWERIARYHAWCLRIIAAVYEHRDDFAPSWLTPPGGQP
jgi:hypothetical protein